MAWEEWVIGRSAAQRDAQVEVVGCTIVHQEVFPVLQLIALISQLCRKHEVIIRPTQALSPTQADTIHAHVGVGIIVVFVVVVVIIAVTIAITAIIGVQIVSAIGIVVVAG